MTLSQLAIILGASFGALQLYILLKPETFTQWARRFPRNEKWGFVLMTIGTCWFLYNLNAETISDFANYKTFMMVGFGALGLLTCIFVRDFLAVRGSAIVLLLLAWFTLNHTRWADSQWKLVLVVWAYLWVIGGIWLTISPWRARDAILWKTATPQRLKVMSLFRLALGLLILGLGIFVF